MSKRLPATCLKAKRRRPRKLSVARARRVANPRVKARMMVHLAETENLTMMTRRADPRTRRASALDPDPAKNLLLRKEKVKLTEKPHQMKEK